MATTTNVSSEFNGVAAGEIFVQAFKKADTIGKRMITPLPNVIGSAFLPKLSYSADLALVQCGWNPTGTVGLTDKEITTKHYQIQHELCKKDFAQTFQALNAGFFSAATEDVPADIKEAILLAMINNAGAKLDVQIWQGNNSGSQMNGLLTQFAADSTVIDISGSAVSSSNVVASFDAVYAAVPAEVEDEIVFAVSKNVATAYKQAQASMGLNTTVGAKELDYLGARIESIGGLPANTIVAYRVANLAFATGIESDLNNVRVVDHDAVALDGQVRTDMQFLAGVGYSFGSEIVWSRVIA
jgi:hypothetical protein